MLLCVGAIKAHLGRVPINFLLSRDTLADVLHDATGETHRRNVYGDIWIVSIKGSYTSHKKKVIKRNIENRKCLVHGNQPGSDAVRRAKTCRAVVHPL